MELLDALLDSKDVPADDVVNTIMNRLRSLMPFPKLSQKLLTLIQKIHTTHHKYDEKILDKINVIIKFDHEILKPEILDNLKKLEKNIVGGGYSSLMKRYVRMRIFMDWTENTKESVQSRDQQIRELARMSMDLSNLTQELSWLVTNDAKYGLVFGYELAKQDKCYSLMQVILDALQNAGDVGSGFFVGGYFARLHETDVELWESTLDCIYENSLLIRHLPEITFRSGLTDRTAYRLTCAIKEKKISYDCLAFFRFSGKRLAMISEKPFARWIKLLLSARSEKAIQIAAELVYCYFVEEKKTVHKDILLKVLLHQNVLNKSINAMHGMDEFYWTGIGLVFVQKYQNDSIKIAKHMLENFGRSGIFGQHEAESTKVLDAITRIKPKEVLELALQYVLSSPQSRAFEIGEWIRENAFNLGIPADEILPTIYMWIDMDRDEDLRVNYIAYLLPPEFEVCREFLARYGTRDQVGRTLMRNFDKEGWMGDAVAHYSKKIKHFSEIKAQEKNPIVLSWLEAYIEVLEAHIQRNKRWDERMF